LTLLQALVLGVVQGATEFLPISSSGHLVLVPWLLGWSFQPASAFLFDVLVQWGTLVAVLVYFREDLLRLLGAAARALLRGRPFATDDARLAWLLLLASTPAALLGVLLKERVAATFQSPAAVSLFLLGTAALLAVSEWVGRHLRSMSSLRWPDALLIGLAQSLALFPGISRSGATIAGGLARNMERAEAARFSFLMSVPIMVGAGVIALIDLSEAPDASAQLQTLAAGSLAAAIVGYLAIRWLLRYLSERPLTVFIYYCAAAGLGGLILSLLRG
jgi:undecaprenyl-diphosphatase